MDDLISRQVAIDSLCDNCETVDSKCAHYPCKRYLAIRDLPSAQPERKKGEWRTILYHIPDEGDELYEHYCSECKKTVMISSLKKGRFNYCPTCGARMRGGEK